MELLGILLIIIICIFIYKSDKKQKPAAGLFLICIATGKAC